MIVFLFFKGYIWHVCIFIYTRNCVLISFSITKKHIYRDEAESSNAAADNNNKATTKGFGSTTAAPSTSTAAAPAKVKKADRKWQLEPYDIKEWETWALEQGKAANAGNQGFYAQVQLDGSVRASGVGLPPWERFLGDIPELDDVRTKLTDGAGLV